ncbi:MAG: hypothetical protein IJF15_07670 [Oscillospiraceae bacterium]|nr:hypothetical protein [Oscillospiraceae bacterium]
MKRKRDFTMLYAVLAGFLLFYGIPITLIVWSAVSEDDRIFFPETAQIIEQRDSHGGFLGDGVSFMSVQIPLKDSAEFVQQLKENGFTDEPVPESIRKKVRGDEETCAAADIAHAIWWFRNDHVDSVSPSVYTNYTFRVYDLNTGIYYFIEYDS